MLIYHSHAEITGNLYHFTGIWTPEWLNSRLSGQECGSPNSYTWTQPQEWLIQMILWTWSTAADGRTSREHENFASKTSGNTKSFIHWYHKTIYQSFRPLWYLHSHPALLQISAGSMLLQDEVRGYVWKMPEGGNSFLFQHHFLINEKSTGTRQGFLIHISFYLCCKNKTMTDNCFLLKTSNYQQQQVNTLSVAFCCSHVLITRPILN